MKIAQQIIKMYGLEPLAAEGGYYRETYRSGEVLSNDQLSRRYNGNRSLYTCIYYLLAPDSRSLIHRIKSDEIFHFYSGDDVEMLLLFPGGGGKLITLGSKLSEEINFQQVVYHGEWVGMRLKPGGDYALMGTTVSPGFEFEDLELGNREKLSSVYPEFKYIIMELT